MNETLLLVLLLVPSLIIAIVFHEVAHGFAALLLGDPTAKEQRRLSLNPIRHVHPIGTLLVPGVLALSGLPVFGWAKPVPVSKGRLNNPRFGMMAVAAAGPGTNFVLALIGAVSLGLLARSLEMPPEGGLLYLFSALNFFILINLFLGLLNLIPIPPLDGSHIVEGLLPRQAARVYVRFRYYGIALLLILLLVVPYFFPELRLIETYVLPPVQWAEQTLLELARIIAGE